MLGILANLDFLKPWYFLLLPIPLALLWGRSWLRSPEPQIAPRTSPLLANALAEVHTQKHPHTTLRYLLLWMIWLLLITTLAHPLLLLEKTVQTASGRALSLVIDLSGSMEREDFTLNGAASDRLSVVKKVATAFLAERQGDRVSLILYGDDAFMAAPLSFDIGAVSELLASSGIGMAGRATAIGDALGLAILSLREDSSREKAIILLSDGTNNSGTVEPESAAALAATLGIRIHTIGLGSIVDESVSRGFSTAASADLDEQTLKDIASTSNGEFFRATTTEELSELYKTIDALEGGESKPPTMVLKEDIRTVPMVCLFLLALGLALLDTRFSRKPASQNSAS